MAASKRLQMVVRLWPGCKVNKSLYSMEYNGKTQLNDDNPPLPLSQTSNFYPTGDYDHTQPRP